MAELDPVCNKARLESVGIDNVEVVEKEGHAFVRTASDKVAGIVSGFWAQSDLNVSK